MDNGQRMIISRIDFAQRERFLGRLSHGFLRYLLRLFRAKYERFTIFYIYSMIFVFWFLRLIELDLFWLCSVLANITAEGLRLKWRRIGARSVFG